ncbi:MAG: ParA family protein [Spirochaetales bacterium]|nr:ParA family protein [Spirochaetales bacterium]
MHTIALYNLKGGVGKTTAAVNLAYLCASEVRPTLLFDMDPQGSASYCFRVRPPRKLKARAVIQGGNALEESIRESDFPYLDILPAHISFRNLNKFLRRQKHPKRRYGKVFDKFVGDYDFLFIDCPPGIALEAENIFRACDIVLMPIIPTVLSIETKKVVYSFFKDKGLDSSILLPFFSMVDGRKKLHLSTIETLRQEDPRILEASIPFSSEIEKSSLARKPLCAVSRRSKGARAYAELWEQIKDRLWGAVAS